jgi:hypothetical protein
MPVKPPGSIDELKSLDDYREFMKESLKLVGADEPAYVSKEKFEFDVNGRPWMGHLFLAGKKVAVAIPKLRSGGVMLREGTCSRQRKELHVGGFKAAKLYKEIEKTFLKLKLGYRIVAEDPDAAADESASAAAPAAAAATDAAKLAPERRQEIVKDLEKMERDIERLLAALAKT